MEKHYRHELKYSISYSEYIAMRKRLQNIMISDSHTDSNGLYGRKCTKICRVRNKSNDQFIAI